MYGNFEWYSQSREKSVRIAINGGKISYDKVFAGQKPVSEQVRHRVLKASWAFQEALEEIFLGDHAVQEWKPED